MKTPNKLNRLMTKTNAPALMNTNTRFRQVNTDGQVGGGIKPLMGGPVGDDSQKPQSLMK
jgi:hypothetical protein